MTYSQLRRFVQINVETLLESLTQKQFTHPHRSVASVLQETAEALGGCPAEGAKVMLRLGISAETAIGRLRRTEIMQLSRALHRQWRNDGESSDS